MLRLDIILNDYHSAFETGIRWLGWIPRIFQSFFCAKIFYFWPIHTEAHIKKCKKMLKFFRLFLNIHDFFDFFEVFLIKLFFTVSYSHVHHKIPRQILHRTVNGGRRGKIVLYQKPSKKCAFAWVKIAWNQINLY